MENEVLFKCYDIISVESGNTIGRFKKKYDAELALNWLNGSSRRELVQLKQQNITVNDLEHYLRLYHAGFCYSSSEDFIDDFKKLLSQMSKSYKLKDKTKTPFVKINNYWWKLSLTTPLDNATVYNYSGGHMSGVDCTNLEISEAKDWQYLDWSNTVLWDNSYKTGWISPRGEFYGCDYRCHYMCALMVLKKKDTELEEEGYIKVTKSLENNKLNVAIPYYIKQSYPKPTRQQLDYLAGLEIRDINRILREYYEELDY